MYLIFFCFFQLLLSFLSSQFPLLPFYLFALSSTVFPFPPLSLPLFFNYLFTLSSPSFPLNFLNFLSLPYWTQFFSPNFFKSNFPSTILPNHFPAPLKIYNKSEKSVFNKKVIYNVDNSRGKARMDIPKFMREQYGVNNNNNMVIQNMLRMHEGKYNFSEV